MMFSTKFASLAVLVFAALSEAAPANFQKQNALDAQALNAKFASLTASSSCTGAYPSTSVPLPRRDAGLGRRWLWLSHMPNRR